MLSIISSGKIWGAAVPQCLYASRHWVWVRRGIGIFMVITRIVLGIPEEG